VSDDTTPRIPPGTRREIGVFGWLVSSISGRVSGTEPLHLFLTLGRHKRLFLGWLHFAGRMMPGGRLPKHDTELVILRVAHLRGCGYEFDHHVHRGKKAGIGPAEIERLKVGSEADGWTDREQVLLRAAEELTADRDMSDATWDALGRHLDDRLRIELVLLATHYGMLATTITALRIQPDERRH
jgi:AhpD family alkylhydroperoxidase